jgi:ubiquinone/menaquinone biosynthesis C-methylase UbiE
MDHPNHQPHNHHGPPQGADLAALIELLDLDGEVLASYLFDVTDWVRRLATDLPVRRIMDLGAGTGTGTVALAQRFSGADLIAVDRTDEMLAQVRAKAHHLGLTDRIRTVEADVDVAWPGLDPVDLVWASNSLHEVVDPDLVFANVFAAIRPGGLAAVVEMDAPPRFLPDDIGLGRPGLESRMHDALEQLQANSGPRLGPDWGPNLEKTGFAILQKRTFTIDLTPPCPPSTGRYARAYLRRVRPMLEDRLVPDDLAVLDRLIDSDGPDSLLRRNDLGVRNIRTVWVARRPMS